MKKMIYTGAILLALGGGAIAQEITDSRPKIIFEDLQYYTIKKEDVGKTLCYGGNFPHGRLSVSNYLGIREDAVGQTRVILWLNVKNKDRLNELYIDEKASDMQE